MPAGFDVMFAGLILLALFLGLTAPSLNALVELSPSFAWLGIVALGFAFLSNLLLFVRGSRRVTELEDQQRSRIVALASLLLALLLAGLGRLWAPNPWTLLLVAGPVSLSLSWIAWLQPWQIERQQQQILSQLESCDEAQLIGTLESLQEAYLPKAWQTIHSRFPDRPASSWSRLSASKRLCLALLLANAGSLPLALSAFGDEEALWPRVDELEPVLSVEGSDQDQALKDFYAEAAFPESGPGLSRLALAAYLWPRCQDDDLKAAIQRSVFLSLLGDGPKARTVLAQEWLEQVPEAQRRFRFEETWFQEQNSSLFEVFGPSLEASQWPQLCALSQSPEPESLLACAQALMALVEDRGDELEGQPEREECLRLALRGLIERVREHHPEGQNWVADELVKDLKVSAEKLALGTAEDAGNS